jgi:hypothetical protein
MRKVLFKKWIQRVEIGEGVLKRTQEGTSCWEKEFKNEGVFHQWANSYEESSEGFGNYTVGLVEMSDGTIGEILPSNIKFVEPTMLQ